MQVIIDQGITIVQVRLLRIIVGQIMEIGVLVGMIICDDEV